MYHHCVCKGCFFNSDAILHLVDAFSRADLKEQLTNVEQLDINVVEHDLRPEVGHVS